MRWVLLLLLAGCSRTERVTEAPTGVEMFTDPLTRCQYLTLYAHGITPRLDREGKPVCGEGVP